MSLSTLVPVGILGLLAYSHQTKEKPEPTNTVKAERQLVYDTLINFEFSPETLEEFAAVFRAEGLELEADMLHKRALVVSAPAEIKEARREALLNGMASDDVTAVRELAQAFYEQGMTKAASELHVHANEVEAKKT